jgi:uncharacterized RDD family membrane protein YckC
MSADSPVPAPLWRRLAAAIYDILPAAAVLMAAAALWIGAAGLVSGGNDKQVESYGRWAVGNWPFRIWLVASLFAYYGVSWHRGGQTLGMRAWRIAVRPRDGGRTTWSRTLARFLVAAVSVGAAGLGVLWSLFDARGRMWHDLAANTEVVLRNPPSR